MEAFEETLTLFPGEGEQLCTFTLNLLILLQSHVPEHFNVDITAQHPYHVAQLYTPGD